VRQLVLESWLTLLFVDLTLRFRGFGILRRLVERQSVCEIISRPELWSTGTLSHAMDLACAFYFRKVSSLERSAAATLLLRRHNWRADLVLGIQLLPSDLYAWVEVEGRIVNDYSNLPDVYQVLDRC
jgi:hypothetical protein